MDIQTVLLIILAAIVALGMVLFQYYFRSKRKGRLILILSLLRFLALFGVFFLLINPKFTKNEYRIEKADLIILVDNSTSVAMAEDTIQGILAKLNGYQGLQERFNIVRYGFGAELMAKKDVQIASEKEYASGKDSASVKSSTSFNQENTDITSALRGIEDIHSASNSAIVLLTDGNQTLGQDYEYYGKNQDIPVYPIAVGDTTRYDDLAVARVNANRYAFLNNKYPLEIYVTYNGKAEVTTNLNVTVSGRRVFRKKLSFSDTDNSHVISTLLDANSVGFKNIVVSLDSLSNERNTDNNVRQIAVEVIDEKTDIVIVSKLLHPDIGALKKAIESNEQRSVTVVKPGEEAKALEEADILILYQPDASFKTVYDFIGQKNTPIFTITGSQTNWNFLNQAQKSFSKNSYNQVEEVFPDLNPGFGLFDIRDFSTQDFPPLNANLGEISLNKSGETLLGQRVKGVELDQPLLALIGGDTEREAVLFGENSWKWRMQGFRNDQNFENYDGLIGQIILLLSTNQSRERLTLDYSSVYPGSSSAKIRATYFDKTFVLDVNATIDLQLKNTETDAVNEVPMLLKGSYYETDLSNLTPGTYSFTVSVRNEPLATSGSFTILDFDVEKQLVSTDYRKLRRLAQNSGGKVFFPDQAESLFKNLTEDQRYLPVQKGEQNVVSLIDFRILLALIVAALAAEWLIRKYNGLI